MIGVSIFCLLVHINNCEELQNRLASLLEKGQYSDVTFIVSEGSFEHRVPAHRMILASQSEHFHRLLFQEADAGAEIRLEDAPLTAFMLLLQYAYTGRVEIATSDLKVVISRIVYSSYSGTPLKLKDTPEVGHLCIKDTL